MSRFEQMFHELTEEDRDAFYDALTEVDIAYQLTSTPRHKLIHDRVDSYRGKVKKLLRFLSKHDKEGSVIDELYDSRRPS
jgi:hypothetical protein